MTSTLPRLNVNLLASLFVQAMADELGCGYSLHSERDSIGAFPLRKGQLIDHVS